MPAFSVCRIRPHDNQPFLDTTYNGVEITANKRMSKHWQMVAGLTIGHNRGGVNTATGTGQSSAAAGDLNDPNNTQYSNGIVGNDSNWWHSASPAATSSRGA